MDKQSALKNCNPGSVVVCLFVCFWDNLNPFFARSCAATAGGFSILDLVLHSLAFNNELFWNDFVVHPHYHDPFRCC